MLKAKIAIRALVSVFKFAHFFGARKGVSAWQPFQY